MESLWDKVKKNIVEMYEVAYDKTDELARIGKKKVEMMGLNRAIEKHLSELGGRVYDLIEVQQRKSGIVRDEKVKELVIEIKDLENQLKLKEEEIESIKASRKHEEPEEQNK